MAISKIKKQVERVFKRAMSDGRRIGMVREVALIRAVEDTDGAGNLVGKPEKEYYQDALVAPVTEKDREIIEAGIAEVGNFTFMANSIFNNPANDPAWVVVEGGDRIKTRDQTTHKEMTLFVKTITAQPLGVYTVAVLIREQ